jgi:hypothetical protein
MADPLLPAHLLRRRMILAANVSAALCGSLLLGCASFLPTWVQGVAGGDALLAGVVLGVLCVCWTLTAMALGRHLARLRFRPVAISGSIVLVAGVCGLLAVAPRQTVLWLSICCVAIGAGLGTQSLVFTVAVQSSVARTDRGRAMGLFFFSRLLGQALGTAAFGGVLNRGLAQAAPGTHDIVRELVDNVPGSSRATGTQSTDRDAGRCPTLGLHPRRHHRRRRADRDPLRAASGTAGPGAIRSYR